jgi:hypothetical protein
MHNAWSDLANRAAEPTYASSERVHAQYFCRERIESHRGQPIYQAMILKNARFFIRAFFPEGQKSIAGRGGRSGRPSQQTATRGHNFSRTNIASD